MDKIQDNPNKNNYKKKKQKKKQAGSKLNVDMACNFHN